MISRTTREFSQKAGYAAAQEGLPACTGILVAPYPASNRQLRDIPRWPMTALSPPPTTEALIEETNASNPSPVRDVAGAVSPFRLFL